jgi:ribosomal-protein-alanine N-acetyltransferase
VLLVEFGCGFYKEPKQMKFAFKPMDEDGAHAIAGWHYEGMYAFYDMEQDLEDLEELLDQRNWDDHYYTVTDDRGDLIGFFSFEQEGEVLVVGLGLKPDLTGRGWGQAIFEAGHDFARNKYRPVTFVLGVATFNQRAIHVYRKAGFEDVEVFMNSTNGGQYEFLRMARKPSPPFPTKNSILWHN